MRACFSGRLRIWAVCPRKQPTILNERKTMDYTVFVKEYKAVKDKDSYVTKHITKAYLNYSEKMAIAKSIANVSSHVTDSDGNITEYKRDTMAQYFHTQMNIVKAYTDIDVPAELIVNAYDALCESGALGAILSALESECTILKSMVQMAMDDCYINEADVGAVLSTKLEAFRLMATTAMSALEAIAKEQG